MSTIMTIGIIFLVFGIIFLISIFAKTGFGKGNLEIILDKTTYNYGEKISGKIKIIAKKVFVAKTQTVSVVCIKKSTKTFGKNTSSSTNTVFNKEVNLGSEISYSLGDIKEYSFSFDIPNDLLLKATTNSSVNQAIGLITNTNYILTWEVRGNVKISGIVGLSNNKRISVV